MAEAGFEPVPRTALRDLGVGQPHPALRRAPEAGEGLEELRLSVAVDAGDSHDLAGAHVEAHAAYRRETAVVLDREPLDLEERLARTRRLLVHLQNDLAPHHQAGEALLGRPLPRHGVDELPATEHADPVGDLEYLVQLVTDEDDRHPLPRQRPQDPEEVGRLARGQHCCGLVEDEDVGAAVQRLQDLDALLLTDRDVLNARVGIDREVEALRELMDAAVRRMVVEEDPGRVGLRAEHDVLGDGHHRDEHEVLVDHADPVLDGVLRRVHRDRLALDEDLALVRLVDAVDDVHERRLAGAVLT